MKLSMERDIIARFELSMVECLSVEIGDRRFGCRSVGLVIERGFWVDVIV